MVRQKMAEEFSPVPFMTLTSVINIDPAESYVEDDELLASFRSLDDAV